MKMIEAAAVEALGKRWIPASDLESLLAQAVEAEVCVDDGLTVIEARLEDKQGVEYLVDYRESSLWRIWYGDADGPMEDGIESFTAARAALAAALKAGGG